MTNNKIIKREKNTNYLILSRKEIKEVEKKQFDLKNNIEGIIRIHEKDYPFIPLDTPYFTHFNLQINDNKVSKTYALPRIIKPGYFNKKGEEVLPLLSFENCYLGECILIEQELSYDKIGFKHLNYSLNNIKTIEDLKREMVFRYSISMPDLTKEEIIYLGIAITNIKIKSKF